MMKIIFKILCLLALCCMSQQSYSSGIVLTADMFNNYQEIALADMEGWIFKPGHNPKWASPELNTEDWKTFKPTALHASMEDADGRVEGWFRIEIQIDSSLNDLPLFVSRNLWAATDIYLDGELVHSFGSTGKPYTAYNPYLKNAVPIKLILGRKHFLAMHFVDYETTFTQRELRLWPQNLVRLINISGPVYNSHIRQLTKANYIVGSLTISVSCLLLFLFLLLLFLNPKEKLFQYASILTCSVSLGAIGTYYGYMADASYSTEKAWFILTNALFLPLMHALTLIITEWVLRQKISWISIAILVLMPITSGMGHLFNISWPFGVIEMLLLGYFAFLVISNRKTIKASEWTMVIAMIVLTVGSLAWVVMHKYFLENYMEVEHLLKALVLLSAPILLLLYVGLSYKQILSEREEESLKVIAVTKEKQHLLEHQNEMLENKVAERTLDLEKTLKDLKATQSQLIQAEKMASLGELTAGIAHEIQNPLNFVNNFSEVSSEMIDEMKEELAEDNKEDAMDIANDLKQNIGKILHHGQRADAIVKGMLQHSRTGSGVREATEINALCDEYLRLAYHGLRAKDKSFNATMETDFDQSIKPLNIVQQDIGRVILNLITNAFWAVNEKRKSNEVSYEPKVRISSRLDGNNVIINVSDNGNGIPQDIREKIFQPFFTTKPTGQGTGLGLSLSYDIIKSHGGQITVESEINKGTQFTITLPAD